MTEALEPLKRLEELFRAEIEKCGGRLVHFSISPSKREVTVLLDLDDDLFLDPDQRKTKDEFEEIERNFHVERKDEKAVEAIEGLSDLERRLANPEEGIF